MPANKCFLHHVSGDQKALCRWGSLDHSYLKSISYMTQWYPKMEKAG